MRTVFSITDVSKVVFKAKNSSSVNVQVTYSIGKGTTWIGAKTLALTTSATDYTYNINAVGNVLIKYIIVITNTEVDGTLYIDEVDIFAIV